MTAKRLAKRTSMVRLAAAGAVAVGLVAAGATLAIAESGSSARKPLDVGSRLGHADLESGVKKAGGSSNKFKVPTGKFRGATTDGIADSYIVVLKNAKASEPQVTAAADSLTKAHSGKVRKVFASSLRGFSANLTAADAQQLALDPAVDYVEQNRRVRKSDTQNTKESPLGDRFNLWGLDRIDQPFLPVDHGYTHPGSVTDVHVYVIDTGVNLNHAEFSQIPAAQKTGWSATWDDDQKKACGPMAGGVDDDGHGTFVASEIVGKTFGVAKNAPIESVKVLACDGFGSTEQVIEGVNHVAATAVKPAVANMSLGDDQIIPSIDVAVNAAIDAGVTVVVAAGNEAVDACGTSPARVPNAITVGATDLTDFRASFSNYGSCLDVFAPGVSIAGAGLFADPDYGNYTYMGGTSMAAPLVAGDVALLLHSHPTWTPAQVRDAVVKAGVSGTVHGAGTGSTTKLLRVGEPSSPAASSSTSVALRARANNLIVSAANGGGSPLIANRYNVGGWESLKVVPAGDGVHVALLSGANGRYVTAENGGNSPLIANRTSIGAWEQFTLVLNDDGSYSLKASANNKFVTADNGGSTPLIANRPSIGPWERFDLTGPAANVYVAAGANNRVVTADNGGAKPLIANRDLVGGWEQFDVVDAGSGYAAFLARANGKFVTADNGGNSPLIANRATPGSWERFSMYNLGLATVFQANANGRFVTADNGGNSPLIANRTSVGGTWELFIVVTMDELNP